MDNLIRNGDFCEIVTDKFIPEGVKRGSIVWVAGHKALPISQEDPYTQRIKFFVHIVRDKHVKPDKLYVMDPVSIQKLSERKQKALDAIYRKDFDLELESTN